jgi:hypothetical protein
MKFNEWTRVFYIIFVINFIFLIILTILSNSQYKIIPQCIFIFNLIQEGYYIGYWSAKSIAMKEKDEMINKIIKSL